MNRIDSGLASIDTPLGRTTPPPMTPMVAGMLSRDITVRTDRARARRGWVPVSSHAEGRHQLRSSATR